MKNKTPLLVVLAILLFVLFFLFKPSGDVVPVLVWEATTVEIERDYDQRSYVRLSNEGEIAARVRVEAESPGDLPAGFVGRGTMDWHEFTYVEMQPGETWRFPFIAHAVDSAADEYSVPIRSLVEGKEGEWEVASEGSVKVKVAPGELKIGYEWLESNREEDRARLIKVLRIRNEGATIPNFSLEVPEGLGVMLEPRIEGYVLKAGSVLEARARPQLRPGFERVSGSMTASGFLDEEEVPFEFSLPEGKGVFVTLSRSTAVASASGQRCTNQNETSYTLNPTRGTPTTLPRGDYGVSFAGGGSSGSLGGGLSVGSGGSDAGEEEEEEDEGDSWGFTGLGDIGGLEVADDETREEEDEGQVENALTATEGTDGETPSSVFGGDGMTYEEMLDALKDRDPSSLTEDFLWNDDVIFRWAGNSLADKPSDYLEVLEAIPVDELLRDMEANTRETVVYNDKKGGKSGAVTRRSRENTTAFDFHNFGFGDNGTRIRVGGRRNISGGRPVRQATMGQTGGGNMLAAYATPNGEASEIELHDLEGSRSLKIGEPGKKLSHPKILRQEDGASLAYLEDGSIRLRKVSENLDTLEDEIVSFAGSNARARSVNRVLEAPDGTPRVVASFEDGKVAVLGGEEPMVFEGKAGDALYADGEFVGVFQREDGSIVGYESEESRPVILVEADARNGPPSLVMNDKGEPRLAYHKNLSREDNEGGTFKVDMVGGRWSEATNRMLQPEEPVHEAAVVVDFDLPYGKAHYLPMDTEVFLNGKSIGKIDEKTPSGRYVFPAPADALNYVSATQLDAKPNEVSMKIDKIGKGNFHVIDNVEIHTRHSLVQEFLVADSEEEAQKIAEKNSPEIRHGAPDLMLVSNAWTLPRGAQAGERLVASIGAFNTGDLAAVAGKVIATAEGRVIGDGVRPLIRSYQRAEIEVEIELPADWRQDRPLRVIFEAPVEGDANAENNFLKFYALRDYVPSIAGPTGPIAVAVDKLIAGEVVETVDLSQPFEFALQNASSWYRFPAPEEGELQVEVSDAPEDLIVSMDLMNQDGDFLSPDDDIWEFEGEYLYLRIGLKPGRTIPSTASVVLTIEE